jgi:chloride channel 3/4/5
VQDAARAQLRRKAKRQEQATELYGRYGWRRRIWDAYDAGQAWIVVTLVGMDNTS